VDGRDKPGHDELICPPPSRTEIERLIQLLTTAALARSARRPRCISSRSANADAPLAPRCRRPMDKIVICKTCGNIDTKDPCRSARYQARCFDHRGWWPMSPTCGRWERANAVNGRYHVLGGTLIAA